MKFSSFLPFVAFGLATLAPVVLAQSPLKLPTDQNDIRKLMQAPADEGCTLCGVVTNIRSVQREVVKGPATSLPGDGTLTGTPLIGRGDAVKDARVKPVATSYKVTVRYDNGQYAAFDQDEPPTVRRGDKVRVVEGRAQLR